MSGSFDPYHRWLGIPPEEQPPSHYRLLGIKALEDNPDVVEAAADRQMGHLRTYQIGQHGELSQKLLNEVATARLCLLQPEKKAAYDAQLRQQLAAKKPKQAHKKELPRAVPLPAAPKQSQPLVRTGETSAALAARKRKPGIGPAIAAAVVGLMLVVGLIVWGLSTRQQPPEEAAVVEAERESETPAGATGGLPASEKQAEAGDSDDKEPPKAEPQPGPAQQPSQRPAETPEPEPEPAEPISQDPEPVAEPELQPQEAPTADLPAAEQQQPEPEELEPEEPQRLAIPSGDEQQKVLAQLEKLYDLAGAKTRAEKVELAEKIFELGGQADGNPTEQFVLLRKAMELAGEGGNAALMVEAIDAIDAAFEIDALDVKRRMLVKFARDARDSVRIRSLVETAMPVFEEALSQRRYETAMRLVEAVCAACGRSGGRQYRKTLHERRGQLKRLVAEQQRFERALARLESDPDDAEAHLAVGRWYCCFKGDWQRGLPHLVKCSDEGLKAAAQQELTAAPTEPADQIKLADAWWDLATTQKDETKTAMMYRAGHWYEQALPNVKSVLTKKRVDNRLAKLADIEPPAGGGPPSEAAASTGGRTGPLPRIDKIVVWNQHNGPDNNHGTRVCNLALYREGKEVWRQNNILVPWVRDQDTFIAIKVRRVVADHVRVEIMQWHAGAGGLAEVEVFSGDKNIAAGCKVNGADRGENVRKPACLTDGITTSAQMNVGYWVSPQDQPAWAEIELCPRAKKSDGKAPRSLAGRFTGKVQPFNASALQSWRSLEGHTSFVRSVAFSPDCSMLASACDDRTIKLWNTNTGEEFASLYSEEGGGALSIAFSPEGKRLAGGYRDHTVKVWNVATGECEKVFQGHVNVVWAVVFSPDGKTLASGSDDQTVILWDAATGRARHTLVQGQGQAHVRSVAFSPDGRTLASGSVDWVVKLWKVKSGQLRQTLNGHNEQVLSVAFSPDGKTLASGGADDKVVLWDTATGRLRKTLVGNEHDVCGVAFHPDGKVLASGNPGQKTIFWGLQGRRLLTIASGNVATVAFSPDGSMFAFGGAGGNLALWDFAPRKRAGSTPGRRTLGRSPKPRPPAAQTTRSKRPKRVKHVQRWDPASAELLATLQGHTAGVRSVAFSSDGEVLASASADQTVRFWNVAKAQFRAALPPFKGKELGLAFSPKDSILAVANGDHTTSLWNPSRRQLLGMLAGHTSRVDALAFSGDGSLLATASVDKTVIVWNTALGRAQRTISGNKSNVRAVALSPNGSVVASGHAYEPIKLHKVATGELLWSPETALAGGSYCLAFSPDGSLVASGNHYAPVLVREVATGKLRHRLEHHKGRTNGVAFSPDGVVLASANDDKTVGIWDVGTGKFLRALEGFGGIVWSVAFCPDGSRLAAAGEDGIIRVWGADRSK